MNNNKQTPPGNTSIHNDGNDKAAKFQPGHIIAVGGGKGGVGKSLISVALGFSLSLQNKKTVLVDADFSSPSLVNLFETTQMNSDFSRKQVTKLRFPLYRTSFPNLMLLSGYSGILGISEYLEERQQKFLTNLMKIEADYIILDLGSDSSPLSIQLFNAADEKLIVTNPEPMSILESFNFVKSCQYQLLKDTFKNHPRIMNFITATFRKYDFKKLQLLQKLIEQSGHKNILRLLRPKLILNMLYHDNEALDILALQIASEELLGVRIEHISDIHYNENIRSYLKTRQLKLLTSIPEFKILTEKICTDGKNTVRNLKFKSLESLKHKDVICSCRCSLWENCTYQRGGYPCRIKYIGFINTQSYPESNNVK